MKHLAILLTILFVLPFISASCSEGQININSASLEELENLNGIGPVKAQAIIDTRVYETIENLLDVYGIAEITLNKIISQGLACIENEQDPEELEIIESSLEEDANDFTQIKTNPEPKIIELENINLNSALHGN